MSKIKSKSVKNILVVAASALTFSISVYATELVSVGNSASDKGRYVTPQCITNGAGTRLCCTGGWENMTCETSEA